MRAGLRAGASRSPSACNSTLRLYRNGQEVAATSCAGLSTLAPDALGIGVKLDATGQQPETHTPGFWDGRIDELAVFHFALSAEQVRKLYDVASPNTPAPRSALRAHPSVRTVDVPEVGK